MPYIVVGDLDVEIRYKNIKNSHLTVSPPDGRVRVSVPLSMQEESVRLFVLSRLKWIKRQQIKYREQQRQTEREYISRESHYFLGRQYLLNIIDKNKNPPVTIEGNQYINLYVSPDGTLEARKRRLNNWYRKEIKKRIPTLLEKWQPIIGVEVSDWKIKKMKTKWGSCNAHARRIWLNLDLIKKPEICLEYILVHELVHLLERHHNERFIAYMDQFMPNWRARKEELNRQILDYQPWDY